MHAPPPARNAASRLACAGLLCVASFAAAAAEPEAVRLGLGTYFTRARDTSADSTPPVATWRTGPALERAAPTNQWYSSVMFQRWSQPLHAHPIGSGNCGSPPINSSSNGATTREHVSARQ